jgi:hypothetical protein
MFVMIVSELVFTALDDATAQKAIDRNVVMKGNAA